MKTLTAKTGILITILLVSAVLVFGFVSSNTSKTDDCGAIDKCSSSDAPSKLNIKGMTRHLLDFYK